MSLLRNQTPVRRGRHRAGIGLASLAVLAGLCVTPAVATPVPAQEAPTRSVLAASTERAALVAADSTWRYLENDTFPSEGDLDPLNWTKAGFDDTGWKSGAGTFGGKVSGGEQSAVYNSSHTASVQLEMNAPDQSVRVRTYFFRTTFELTQAQIDEIAEVRSTMRSDDGAVVYVNGHEVVRNDVPAGSEGLSYASGSTTGLDTTAVSFGPEVLVAGTNTIAVSVHNDRPSSSDIWFDLADVVGLTAEEARPRPSRIILTPTHDPSTSQHVSFQGAVESDTLARIQWRPAAGGALRQASAPIQPGSISNEFGHFSGTMRGLKPDTAYAYRVSSNGNWSDWMEFTTEDPTETDFSYLYFADAQVGLDSTWPKVVDQALERAPEAIGSVHAGDLIDVANRDVQWRDWFAGMETAAATKNIMAAPGNHEYSSDALLSAWKAHFEYEHNNPNEDSIGEFAQRAQGDSDVARQYKAYFDRWADIAAETVYFADYQGVRFITINATRNSNFLTPANLPSCSDEACPANDRNALWIEFQAHWLDHVLENSDAKWNVVTFHQPVYSTSSGRNEPVLREHWVPVFQKHDIDLVQMGHDHTYARGYNNDDVTETPGMTTGPVYMVSNSGAKHYNLENDERNVWTNNGATQVQKGQHITTYQVVDVSADALTVKSYIAEIGNANSMRLFRNGEQLDNSKYQVGDLWDEFTVHKTDEGQKAVVEAGMEAPDFEDLSPVPTFTTDLDAQTPVAPGQRTTLRVEVDAQREPAIQWQVDTGDGWTDITGENGQALVLGRVSADEIGNRYRVVVTAGTREVTSVETELVDAGDAPVFTTDLPETRQVKSGNKLTLQVEAAADRRVTYQWQKLEGGTWSDMVGRTGPVLALNSVRTNGERYRVVATAGVHSSTSTVTTVRVVKKASNVRLPKRTLRQGKPARLTVRANQAGTLKVVVRQGGKKMVRTLQVRKGATKVTLGKLARNNRKVRVRLVLTPHNQDHAKAVRVVKNLKARR